MAAEKDRCITCHKDYDATSPLIYVRLVQFGNWCICQECHDVALKAAPPGKHDKH